MKPAARGKKAQETPADRSNRAGRIAAGLRRLYPDADCALHHQSALQLLVATILSAQCTDERVNLVTPALFARYPDAAAFANADQAELEQRIHSTGFFRNKARSILGMGRALVECYGGVVPDTMDELVKLPGVGRKTANVVLGTWFHRPAIFVDTHVTRLAGRLELSASGDPVRIEADLQALLPEKDWTFSAHALIWHGRRICSARKPLCEQCGIRSDCPFPDKTGAARTKARP